ncbi:hypothetical protein LU631_04705 [Erwinia tracheiphila]|uniref:DUF1311 domain-containing protein n=2 Tax=Erwinia tracheiphila TaxID=65700 RepID=A0A345CXQ5_9GAMM|nr:hypothetical protein [Erwinia tracheiphila]AXF78222.1 hypothetical protein AV903_22950 [Erwinia tracheiphila]EOS95556.1 hypothetical protein ETR_07646 [Erwinia tracheiphila PSU-1]UIA83055.1 hypothetical protein LU604_22190 [Erwinia tracheiphila]UIA88676.1 hypothetical protein LU631_04705 [Erwinia tracheiphila]UIA91633.1 hypothetical protein LU632_21650 [Erwinia tracheiphila]
MKIINVIFLAALYSFNVTAAFTEPEMSQLAEINKKSIEKTESEKKNLEATINKTINNLPNEKTKIMDLSESWDATIKKKCKLSIFESLNTDAEIAEENLCLYSEYKAEKEFFEDLNY